jgi:hypothetical protein
LPPIAVAELLESPLSALATTDSPSSPRAPVNPFFRIVREEAGKGSSRPSRARNETEIRVERRPLLPRLGMWN